MFTDIRIINLTFTYTPKTAGILMPTDYLNTVTSLADGHDYATIHTQANLPTTPYPTTYAKLNIAGHFIKGKHEGSVDPTTGLDIQIVPYYVNVLTPGCEGITVENVADKFYAFRNRLAELSGLVEYNNWINDYTNEHYTTTHDAFVDFSDLTTEWWIDHEVAFPRINNAV